MQQAIVRVVVWIDGVECGSAEHAVPSELAVHVAQAALVQVEDPDLDLAFENQTAAIDLCPVCKKPCHATEGTEDGTHAECVGGVQP